MENSVRKAARGQAAARRSQPAERFEVKRVKAVRPTLVNAVNALKTVVGE